MIKMVLPFDPENKRRNACCNMCGTADKTIGYTYIKARMPYGSENDFDLLDLCLCADCADQLVASCKIDPINRCV